VWSKCVRIGNDVTQSISFQFKVASDWFQRWVRAFDHPRLALIPHSFISGIGLRADSQAAMPDCHL
jgi:hypothetical protein